MKKGLARMKLLKIESNKGQFLTEAQSYKDIDQITKEDLLFLAQRTLTEDCTFDAMNVKDLPNQAHQIIYKHIFDQLADLSKRRDTFRDESDRLFLEAFQKYKAEAGAK